MAENTKIQWCHHTFNHIRGCTKVAAGCANCYADALSKRNPGTLGVWGDHGTRVLASPSYWKEPLKWNRDAERAGVRARVFCASLADVFEDWPDVVIDHNGKIIGKCPQCGHREPQRAFCSVCREKPEQENVVLDDIRRDLFALIDATPHLDWLLLTKRPENIQKMIPDRPGTCVADFAVETRFRHNVWLGTSIACKSDLRNIDHLYGCADLCPVRFISVEPLIEDVGRMQFAGIDWLIIGGESGPHARPCDVAWIRSLKDQAQAAGVPVFVKQIGTLPVNGKSMTPQEWRLRDPKGGDPAEWPADLRVQEYPQPAI